jgi:hypothetical protein
MITGIMVTKLDLLRKDLTMSKRTLMQHNYLPDGGFVRNSILDGGLEKYKKEDQFLEESLSTDLKKATTNISRKNWEMSYKKWQWLVILARLHIRFHSKNGFSFLKVVGKCGYCIEFKSNCFNCNLYKQNLCCSIKYLTKEKRKNIVLWKYLRAMQKGIKNYNVKFNWKKDVLTYAIEMRDAIKKDKPKRQIKISSIFTQLFFSKVA